MFNSYMTYSQFLTSCEPTHDLTAKLLSGIKRNMPALYDAMSGIELDFNTVAQLVNVICIDDKSTLDTLMVYAFNDDPFTREDHIYWTTLLMQSCSFQLNDHDTKMLAFLWMLDYLATERDTKEGPTKVTELLARFEECVEGGEN